VGLEDKTRSLRYRSGSFGLCGGNPWRFLVAFAIDGEATDCPQPAFDLAGKWVFWGNIDGTVSACDIEDVGRRLAECGLGW
jgi:hypothetical protein